MSRVLLHVVSGVARSGKSALIARLVGAREAWLGMVNNEITVEPREALRRLPLGCPCCTGRVALQVALIRALRELRPARVLLELPDAAHAQSFAKALAEWPLAQHFGLGRAIQLPRDRALAAEDLELD